METIGDRLKAERLRLGLTQEEMAGVAKVARSAQANYEKGERSPDTQYLALACGAGVDIGFVITGVRTGIPNKLFDARTLAFCEKFQRADEVDRQFVERFLNLLDRNN